MAKFVVVKNAPEKLGKGEIVISAPDFLEQIEANIRKAPRNNQTARNHLREVLGSIAGKYDQEMNVMTIKMANYEGIAYKNNEDLGRIIVGLLRNEYPTIFDKYLDYQLKNRPINTKLVYYVGNFASTTAFYQNGLDLLEEKDLESYLTGKPKKTVGKPAVTNAEAAELKDEQ